MNVRDDNLDNAKVMLDLMEGRVDAAINNLRVVRDEIESIRRAIKLEQELAKEGPPGVHPPDPLELELEDHE